MAIVIPDVGEVGMLELIFKAADTKLHLFTDDETVDEDTVVGDFTECAATGYSAITLDKDNFTCATVVGVSSATYAEQTFTFTASTTCYGWYLTDAAGTLLLAAEKWAAPISIVDAGTIKITPVYQLA